MKFSKKVFLIISIIFLVLLLILSYDISQRTTFPGSKPLLKESVAPQKSDSSQKK